MAHHCKIATYISQVCIGPDDFALVMGILNKNIAEGQLDTPGEESPSASSGEDKATEEATSSDTKTGEPTWTFLIFFMIYLAVRTIHWWLRFQVLIHLSQTAGA